MRHRKTSSYLNGLRQDVQGVMDTIDQLGTDIDAACHDLARSSVHDIATNPDMINDMVRYITSSHTELGKQLKQFKIVAVKYSEFF
jgi:hypothetical protein